MQLFSEYILKIKASCGVRIIKFISSCFEWVKNYRNKEGRIFLPACLNNCPTILNNILQINACWCVRILKVTTGSDGIINYYPKHGHILWVHELKVFRYYIANKSILHDTFQKITGRVSVAYFSVKNKNYIFRSYINKTSCWIRILKISAPRWKTAKN
jgi:hypothetical protein